MAPSHSQSPNALRIIIAYDHDLIRQILVKVVRETLPASTVVETADGLQAFEAYKNCDCHFLVSNHCMPNMDGMTLIRHVRKKAPELPILMVSVKPEAETDAFAAGANWFLRKDSIFDQMSALLRQHVRA